MWTWWHAAVIAVGGSIALVVVVVVGIVAWNRHRNRARLQSAQRHLTPSRDSR
jgi:hypothetical protein